jgi:hypothetical protein
VRLADEVTRALSTYPPPLDSGHRAGQTRRVTTPPIASPSNRRRSSRCRRRPRDVGALRAGRGIPLTDEAGRAGGRTCGPASARPGRRRPPRPGDQGPRRIASGPVHLTMPTADGKRKRFREVKTAFHPACRRAGVHDVRFRDLRHTLAHHLRMAGVD